MTSERTKNLKKKKRIFGLISLCLCVGTLLFFIIYALATKEPPQPKDNGIQFVSDEAKDWLFGLAVTGVVAIVATIIIKDKMNTFMWMLSVVMSVILFGSTGMFIVLALWFIDEYILHTFYNKYKEEIVINKQIDLRS